MNTLKKLLGICWMLLAPCLVVFMIAQASEKTAMATEGVARTNTALQWGIILLVFIPISCGFVLFGFYAVKGEYTKLPASSNEPD
jgi:hypothetical protein